MNELLEKALPADLDAERTILGALLQNAEWLDTINLTADAFFQNRHGLLFEIIESLYTDGQPVEIKALSGRLRDKGQLEQVGGVTYIASLIDGTPGSNPFYYAERIRSKHLQRRCMRAGESIVTEAMDSESGAVSLAYAEKAVAGLADDNAGRGVRLAADVAMDCLARIERSEGPRGIKTGLVDVDALMLSLEPETLTLVGARPSNGKSAFGLTLALNVATENIGVGFFSLEMTAEQLTDRLLAMLTGIDLMELRAGYTLNTDQWRKLTEAQGKLQSLPIYIDDTRGLTAGQVCARMRRLEKQQSLGVGIIDYLTRLRFDNKREMRHELGDSAKRFKDLSGELQIPVVALSQLSRASVATGKVRRPQLSDLRESGNLEEDADNVLFVHREEMYDPTDENRGRAEVIVAKQRQGPAPEIIPVSFHGPTAHFRNAWRH